MEGHSDPNAADKHGVTSDQRVISTGTGFLYSLGLIAIVAPMFPGGMFLLTGWGIFHWKSDLIVALLVIFTVASLIWWSVGWAHYRYAKVESPTWVVHPATRTCLAVAFFTFVAAWPFGSSQDVLVQLGGVALAPLIGGLLGLGWFLVFGLKQLARSSLPSDKM